MSWFEQIASRSLFDLLDAEAAAKLASLGSAFQVVGGGLVPRRAADLYIVSRGGIELLRPGTSEVVGRVTPGRAVELRRLLAKEPDFEFEWRATETTELVCFPGDLAMQVLGDDIRLLTYLRRVVRSPGLRRLKNDLRLYGSGARQAALMLGQAKQGEWKPIEEALDKTRGILIIESGSVQVNVEFEDEPRSIGPFKRGDYLFVDAALAHYTSQEETRVLYLPLENMVASLGAASAQSFLSLADPVQVRRSAIMRARPSRAASSVHRRLDDEEDDDDDLSAFRAEEKPSWARRRGRRPAVRQHDELDCGAACLSSVARHYGRRISVAQYRSLVHVTRDGASMLALKSAAEQTGFSAAGVMAGLDSIRRVKTPFIALMKFHFVVVYEVGAKSVVLADPARGLVTESVDSFAAEWSQTALLLAPTEALPRYPESKTEVGKYLSIFRGSRLSLLEIFVASVLLFLAGLGVPVFLQYFVDTVLPQSGGTNLGLLLGLLFVVLATQDLLSLARQCMLIQVTTRFDAILSALFVGKLARLPLSFYAVRTVGDITQRVGELESIRRTVLDGALGLLSLLVGAVVSAAVIGLYSGQLLTVLLLALILPGAFVLLVAPRMTRELRALYKAEGQLDTRAWEQFRGLGSVKALGAEVAARWRWNLELAETLRKRRGLALLSATVSGASQLFQQAIQAGVIMVGVYLYTIGQLSLGHLLAVSVLSGTVVGAAVQLLESWHQWNGLGVAISRVDDVFTAAEEDPATDLASDAPGAEPITLEGAVELEGVDFQYGSELSPIVLEDVSLSIKAGETIAVVGRSGSGKTTLGYMFNLLYPPTAGRLCYDGRPSNTVPLRQVRAQVGMIVQDNSIFSGTILENIALGDAQPSFEAIVRAAKLADAHEFISAMPNGYSTALGESGEGLSGGQKQRINIARALYREPAILVMDEATSSLDAVSEARIVRNLKARRGTTIVIAHRLNTVMHADRIVVLDAGQVVEVGAHAELVSRPGPYSRLFAKQLAV